MPGTAQAPGALYHIILRGSERKKINSHKIYALWDAYPHADLVTYPSTYEGFGNALLEAVYFKKLIVVNRYPVYVADIEPLGFDFIEVDGFVDDQTVEKTKQLLQDPKTTRKMAQENYEIARENFSLEVLQKKITEIINTF